MLSISSGSSNSITLERPSEIDGTDFDDMILRRYADIGCGHVLSITRSVRVAVGGGVPVHGREVGFKHQKRPSGSRVVFTAAEGESDKKYGQKFSHVVSVGDNEPVCIL